MLIPFNVPVKLILDEVVLTLEEQLATESGIVSDGKNSLLRQLGSINIKYNEILAVYARLQREVTTIVHYLEKQRSVSTQDSVSLDGNDFWSMLADAETFLFLTKSLMDLIAKFTRHVFPEEQLPPTFTNFSFR